jgi:hypothetical protein
MKIHRLLSSLQNGLTKRSSSYTIWFQMRCWMTSCLNQDYLILIFIHFPYLFYENPSFIIVSAETEYFSTRSLHMVFISRNWFAMQGPVAIILISWNVIFIWETGYWTRAKKKIRLIRSLKKFIFRYQDLVEKYSVSAETIINDGFS